MDQLSVAEEREDWSIQVQVAIAIGADPLHDIDWLEQVVFVMESGQIILNARKQITGIEQETK